MAHSRLESSAINQVGGAYASDLAKALCPMANIDPCSMLKQADVQALFAFPLGSSTADHLGNCTWRLADSNNGDGLDVAVNNDQHALANDIDPAALPGFIQKFGALCNEIFTGLGA